MNRLSLKYGPRGWVEVAAGGVRRSRAVDAVACEVRAARAAMAMGASR